LEMAPLLHEELVLIRLPDSASSQVTNPCLKC